jgi:hypothetical protein
MRGIIKTSLAAFVAVLLCIIIGRPVHTTAATPAQQGITITPATLTLSLEKGANSKTAEFSIKNSYDSPVSLRFSFAQPIATPGASEDSSALKQLSISATDITVPAGGTVKPAVTLKASDKLAPGSQQVELVISQVGGAGGNISIIPSVRMPLAIVKQDGAVTSLNVSGVTKPSFAFSLPGKTTLTFENTGNMTTIPRGYVSVVDPRGREISKGVLNTASAAVTPGSQLKVSTGLTALNHAWLPGVYRVQVHYGTGGGTNQKISSASLFYLPVWQVLLLPLLGAMAYCGRQIWLEWSRLRKPKSDTQSRPPKRPGKPLTAGRGIA